jgi:hypothetical protein
MMTDAQTNIALCVILVALLAIVPIGCVMTSSKKPWPKQETPPKADDTIKPAA